MAKRVLITGARAAAALHIAREFDRAGYEAHAADCAPARISGWSKAISKLHAYPSPVRDPSGFASAVAALVDALDPVLVIPCCEEVFHLARPATAAHLGQRLFAPQNERLARLHDKAAFAHLCRTLDLPVPETRCLGEGEALEAYADTSQQWVFKPRFGRFGVRNLIRPPFAKLARLWSEGADGWLAQRWIEGRDASFYAVARAGKLVAFAAYGSRWRLEGGASISFDPLEAALTERLQKMAATLAQSLGLTGQFACDAMVEPSGRPWLIECNPRATSGVHLFPQDGRLADAMMGERQGCVLAGADSHHLLPAMLTFGLVQALRERRLMPWWQQVAGGHDVAGVTGDRMPGLGAMLDGAGFMFSGWRSGTSATAATTADIEWNGETLT